MRTIYFVRHSIRDTSVHSEMAGLTLEGHQRVQVVVDFLLNADIQYIISTPYPRTMATAEPIAKALGKQLRLDDIMRERVIGEWVSDFDTFAQQQWTDWTYCLGGGESLRAVQHRMVVGLQRLFPDMSGNLVIVGHGTAFATLFNYYVPTFNYQEWHDMPMPALFQVEIDEEGAWHSFIQHTLA